jgi:hypothetical protein
VLETLKEEPRYASQVEMDTEKIKALFEEIFRHTEFTGRSGTFFAYEGLGSIYWHMISKLLLAVQETVVQFEDGENVGALLEFYEDIKQGLGTNKPPEEFGAFPTDPYSHTPKGRGAKQPGMTGAVKEEILTRLTELGLVVENGRLQFNLMFLDSHELLTASEKFTYLDLDGKIQEIELEAGSLAYTICQTPVILQAGDQMQIIVDMVDGTSQTNQGNELDAANSKHIFDRDGAVKKLTVVFPANEG